MFRSSASLLVPLALALLGLFLARVFTSDAQPPEAGR